MTKRLLVALTLLAALCCLPSASEGQTGKRFAAPKSGVWRITGKDVEGLKWLGTMRLAARARHGVRATYSGYIDWRSSDRRNSGREFFNASFYSGNGGITIVGYRVARAKGDIAAGRYSGHLSGRGRSIVRGTWGGRDVIAGKWSAKWSRSR
ncbi:MAG: hypothetical protein IPI76_11020 [Chloracidobacterium sp.]|nr:hypothetical protein [Chloracidobacterium sp.]